MAFANWIESFAHEFIPCFVVMMMILTLTNNLTTVSTYSNAKDIIAKHGAKLIFQPKYSPDLNKIEPQWANLKNGIRKNNNSKQNFFQKLEQQINKMMT